MNGGRRGGESAGKRAPTGGGETPSGGRRDVPVPGMSPRTEPWVGTATACVPFAKLHGLGNDYVFVDGFELPIADPAGLARRLADRHRGVGGDGLIVLLPPRTDDAHLRMRMFNADGSEAEMCGNGVRCLARFAVAQGRADASPVRVETGAGTLELRWAAGADGALPDEVEVDMGPPALDPALVPVDVARLEALDDGRHRVDVRDHAGEASFAASFCSMGNPHAVIELDDARAVADFDLARFGPLLERHAAFPARMNVHACAVVGGGLVMRTWERGSGVTQACGTGACAVAVTMARRGRCPRDVAVELPGGILRIRHDDDSDHVFMTGPAESAFSGMVDVPGALIAGT